VSRMWLSSRAEDRRREQIAHLAVEVGDAGLGPADDADLDVALRAEPLGGGCAG
jgi:hypothetical protein